MLFKLGEQVKLLHEVGDAVVIRFIDAHHVIIEDETGFERPMPITELVKIRGNQNDSLNAESELFQLKEEDMQQDYSKTPVVKKPNFWEIDLHTHELLDSEAGMTPSEILRYQLSTFKSFFRNAQDKHIKKLVIIHGVGEGVLKHEIRTFLSHQDSVEYFDASYREYGKGATEVEIFYN